MGRLGFEYRWRAPERLLTVDDYRRAARRRLPKMVWYYVDEGADDLVTIRANRQAFGRYALWPAVLGAVAAPDLTTTVAGCPIDLPVLLAPTGFTGLSHWRGDLAAQRAAELENVRYVALHGVLLLDRGGGPRRPGGGALVPALPPPGPC